MSSTSWRLSSTPARRPAPAATSWLTAPRLWNCWTNCGWAVPKEVRAAEEVLAQKDHIINLAQTEARRTKATAEDDYRERLNKHELTLQAEQRAMTMLRDAEERARRMVDQAETQAQACRTEADAYALRSLRTLEQELSNINSVVRRGIDVLSGPASANLSSHYFRRRRNWSDNSVRRRPFRLRLRRAGAGLAETTRRGQPSWLSLSLLSPLPPGEG